jgi:hypothetical protein
MKNSRNLQAYGLVAVVCAVALWSDPQRMASAQSKPSGRTYQIFPGISFPNFPGTNNPSTTTRQTPSSPTKPVIPIVEVPTPGLQTARGSNATAPSTNRRRRNAIKPQAPAEKPRTRRPRRAKPQG